MDERRNRWLAEIPTAAAGSEPGSLILQSLETADFQPSDQARMFDSRPIKDYKNRKVQVYVIKEKSIVFRLFREGMEEVVKLKGEFETKPSVSKAENGHLQKRKHMNICRLYVRGIPESPHPGGCSSLVVTAVSTRRPSLEMSCSIWDFTHVSFLTARLFPYDRRAKLSVNMTSIMSPSLVRAGATHSLKAAGPPGAHELPAAERSVAPCAPVY